MMEQIYILHNKTIDDVLSTDVRVTTNTYKEKQTVTCIFRIQFAKILKRSLRNSSPEIKSIHTNKFNNLKTIEKQNKDYQKQNLKTIKKQKNHEHQIPQAFRVFDYLVCLNCPR